MWLPQFMDWFAAGMLFALIHNRLRLPDPPRWMQRFNTLADDVGTCLVLSAGFFLLAATPIAGPYTFGEGSASQAFVRHYLYLAAAATFVLPGFLGTDGWGAWRRFLASPLMAYLGTISYGIFPWHLFALETVSCLRNPRFQRLVLAALAIDGARHGRPGASQLRPHRASSAALLALPVAAGLAPSGPRHPAHSTAAHASASARPCRTTTADPGLIPATAARAIATVTEVKATTGSRNRRTRTRPTPSASTPHGPMDSSTPIPTMAAVTCRSGREATGPHPQRRWAYGQIHDGQGRQQPDHQAPSIRGVGA